MISKSERCEGDLQFLLEAPQGSSLHRPGLASTLSTQEKRVCWKWMWIEHLKDLPSYSANLGEQKRLHAKVHVQSLDHLIILYDCTCRRWL